MNEKNDSFFLFLNGPTPASFSIFSNKHHYNFYNKYVKKCPSSIWCRDSNPRPSDRESLPKTTRPGHPPFTFSLSDQKIWKIIVNRV